MLAVVRTPRTKLRMRGFIPPRVLRVLRHEFGRQLTIKAEKNDRQLENVFDSTMYKEFKKRVTPADYVRIYRENANLTQTEIAGKLGISRAYICDIEHGRRQVSRQFARQLADFFKVSAGTFI